MELLTITVIDVNNIVCKKSDKENNAPNTPYIAMPKSLATKN